MKLDLKIESITFDELQKVMQIFPPSEPAEFGYNKIIPEIEPPAPVDSLIMIPIPQFIFEMTEPQRKEYFRLQNKVERLKQIAAEIEAVRKDDPILGGEENVKSTL